jgi:hypothetical protein
MLGFNIGILSHMSATQLAIRFTERQIETLDALALSAGTNRTAVIKQLVDEAERSHIAALYAQAYPVTHPDVDAFGDLDAFRDQAESERVEARENQTSW